MAHKQNQTDRRIRSAFTAGVTLLLIVVLLGTGRVRVAQGYNADATTDITGLVQHSSFHYEMIRVLAILAGFDKDEAEEIGVAGEAVDLGQFTGYRPLGSKAKTVTIRKTNRFGPNGRLYHFGRRSSQYEKIDADDVRSNTCEYFKGGDRTNPNTVPCTVKGPELDQIKNWTLLFPPNFITEFLAIKDACTRVKFAVDTLNSLTGETTPRIRCPGPSATSGKSRRRG